MKADLQTAFKCSLYMFGMDGIEKPFLSIPPLSCHMFIVAETCLSDHYLEVDDFFWLRYSSFQVLCHYIYIYMCVCVCVCHVTVTSHGVWTDNWIYGTFITHNYKSL
jgi:hypothetical protein